MKVYDSWKADALAMWCEDSLKGQDWFKSLCAYHPNWCPWPHYFWVQDVRHEQWSWYATNRER